MNRNPTIELIENMREQGKYFNKDNIFMGVVISTAPFKVKMNNIILEKANLMICKSVIDRNKAISETNYKWNFKVKDKVLLICAAEKFIIIDKVVDV